MKDYFIDLMIFKSSSLNIEIISKILLVSISFDMIFHDKDRDHIQVGYDIQKIKKILMTDKEKADKVKLEAIKKILIELEEAKQISGWKPLFASTRWNKLSNNVQLERIENYIDGTVLEHNKKITKILEK